LFRQKRMVSVAFRMLVRFTNHSPHASLHVVGSLKLLQYTIVIGTRSFSRATTVGWYYSLVLCLGPHNSALHGLCACSSSCTVRHHLSNTQISVYVSLCTLYTSWSPCVLSCAREVRVTASAAYAWHHSVSHIGTCFLQAFGDRKDSERAA
jgi:hypothetical protein